MSKQIDKAYRAGKNEALGKLESRVKKLRIKVEGGLAPGMETNVYVHKEDVLQLIKDLRDE